MRVQADLATQGSAVPPMQASVDPPTAALVVHAPQALTVDGIASEAARQLLAKPSDLQSLMISATARDMRVPADLATQGPAALPTTVQAVLPTRALVDHATEAPVTDAIVVQATPAITDQEGLMAVLVVLPTMAQAGDATPDQVVPVIITAHGSMLSIALVFADRN